MRLTRTQIQAMSGKAVFLRGAAYYRDGRILSLAWDSHSVRADVQGSGPRPYEVHASFAHGSPAVSCTCPSDWGGLCKHGVAVLLYLLDHDENLASGVESDASEELPGKLRKAGLSSGEDSFLEDYFSATYDVPRLILDVSVRSLGSSPRRGIPVRLSVQYRGCQSRIDNISAFLSPSRKDAQTDWPPSLALSPAQEHFLNLVGSFIPDGRGADAGFSRTRSWRLQPFQLNLLLEQASRTSDILLRDLAEGGNLALRSDDPLLLRVYVRTSARGRVTVNASLLDPAHSDRGYRIDSILPGARLWLWDDHERVFRSLHARVDYRFLVYFLDNERELAAGERLHFLAGVLPGVRQYADVVLDDPKSYELPLIDSGFKPSFEIDVERGALELTVVMSYDNERIVRDAGEVHRFVERTAEGRTVLLRRDLENEEALLKWLGAEFGFLPDARNGKLYLTSPQKIFDFLNEGTARLLGRGEVLLSPRAGALIRQGDAVVPAVTLHSAAPGFGIDWFACDISFRQGNDRLDIPAEAVQEALESGRNFLRLKGGEFVRLDKAAFARLQEVLGPEPGRLMTAHLPFVSEALRQAGISLSTDRSVDEVVRGFNDALLAPVEGLPEEMSQVLRDYQRAGVQWISALRKFRFGGVLADEMGLGKTLQALCAILSAQSGQKTRPSLVVCPTTLVWNWEAEIRKFCPSLKVLLLAGSDRRQRMGELERADLVITSYALLRRDIEKYRACRFTYIVLDEAQNIKNRHTLNARVAKELHADYRLALSGTPLENSIADLWSVFDFLMPGFLGSYEKFSVAYEIPIVQKQDSGRLQELSRRVAPFILRRVKHEVIAELPDKIEQTAVCELEPSQGRLYAAMADRARREAEKLYRQRGLAKSRMQILTLILRLRQLCCHPRLAGIHQRHCIGVSAKLDLLKEMLGELLSDGHKVLVFSQFVTMLDIIREHLEQQKILFEFMDGRTRDRRERVERFNSDPSVRVFLLSLKVGGLGLNLTSADTVILYEPWWNPAVEQQAIDRAHRIGQKKSVLAYRLIARGTIEEKIQELQKRKNFLLTSLVRAEGVAEKRLDWKDIRYLLDFQDEMKNDSPG